MREEFVGVLLMLAAGLILAAIWLLVARLLAPRSHAAALEEMAEDGSSTAPSEASTELVPSKFLSIPMLVLVIQLATLLLVPWAVSAGALSWSGLGVVGVFLLPLAVGCLHAWRKGAFQW